MNKGTRLGKRGLPFLFLLPLIACADGGTKAEEAKGNPSIGSSGTVTIWGWDKPKDNVLQGFKKRYPEISINYVNISSADIMKKLQVSLAAGGKLPDILMIERDFRGQLNHMNLLENLEAAPYEFNRHLIFDYDFPQNSNANSKVVSIPMDMSIAGLAYKRELTKQYFGTDDPKELQALFPNWDQFIAKGKDVLEESGGKVYMFTSLREAWQIIAGQNPEPYADGNRINVKKLANLFVLIRKLSDAGIIDNLDKSSPASNTSYAQNNHIFYPAAIWSPRYQIEPNDKHGSNGRWGLMVPPGGGFIWGGSSFGIPHKAKNKEQAWKFIQWAFLSQEGAEANKKDGIFTHYKAAYDHPGFINWTTPWFGKQDIGITFFQDINAVTKYVPLSQYDDTIITNGVLIALKTLASEPEIGNDELIKKVIQSIKNVAPELK
ncbi:ABC transporter substrate-binding protein [Paenibacillus sp. R14(2021)]|uniref:ABC transporter substrate-binding protein n=1 Tax=Paenibacillus sp. R14(2021) TaxID=2859228 RepID=UPI001C612953|nr:extracellular solute-binding protein [Paenibacillus sp. R14(2021)]